MDTVFDQLVALGGRHRLEHSGFAAAVDFAERICILIDNPDNRSRFCVDAAEELMDLEDDSFSGLKEWLRDLDIPDRSSPHGPIEIWGTVMHWLESFSDS